MLCMLTSAAAGTFSLVFTPTTVEPAAVSSTTHNIKQDFVAQRLSWPRYPQGLREKLTLLNNPLPLCDLTLPLAVFTAVCVLQSGRRGLWIAGKGVLLS